MSSYFHKVTQIKEVDREKYEVFGFAPYWSLQQLAKADLSSLTTLAYFDLPVDEEGEFDTEQPGYTWLKSNEASGLFQKARSADVKVVLTITQMDNDLIKHFLDSPDAQSRSITNTLAKLKEYDFDGVNVDFEYLGDPGETYRNKFTSFVGSMTSALKPHNLTVSTSVYASSLKEPKCMTFPRSQKIPTKYL
jgi:spore germination protein YaaH